MVRFILYFIAGVLLLPEVIAQVTPQEDVKDRVILKFAPLSFFDIDNTVQAGLEIPLSDNRFTIHQEFGYGHTVFNPWYMDWDDKPDKWTFRSRSQFRFYFHEWGTGRMYVAGEYMRKMVTNNQMIWTGVNCGENNGGCDYFEFRKVQRRKIVNALHAKAGWHFYFPRKITLDLYVGAGLRMKNYRSTPDNVGNFNDRRWFDDIFFITEGLYPSVAAGFQLGIPLNWRINKQPK